MPLIKLTNIQFTASDQNNIGGKATSLGKLMQTGFSVPNGFVISSDEFDKFLSTISIDIKLAFKQIEVGDESEIKKWSQKIQQTIKATTFPSKLEKEILNFWDTADSPLVAVRSSALGEDGVESAWPGMLDSFLYTNQDNIISNIKKCWMSCFNERVLQYRKIRNLCRQKTTMAVIVQNMVDADYAGVAFSVNPVNGNRDEVIVEAIAGVGEGLVSGLLTPEQYIVNMASPTSITTINSNTKTPLLSKEMIEELSLTVKNIEKNFNTPIDVEWAYHNQQLYLLQARPVTNLPESKSRQSIDTTVRKYGKKFKCYQSLWDTDAGAKVFETHRYFAWNIVDYALISFRKGLAAAYLSEEDFDRMRYHGQQHTDPVKLAKYKEQVSKCLKLQQQVFKELDDNKYETLSNEQLLAYFDKAMEMSHVSNSLYKATNSFSTEAVFAEFFKQVNNPDIAEVLMIPTGLDITNEEQEDWELLKLQPFSIERALNHIKKYPYLGLNHHTIDDCLNTLKDRYKGGKPFKTFSRINEEKKALKKKQETILAQRTDLRFIVEAIQFLSLTRLRLKNGLAGVDFYTIPLFKEIARRNNMNLGEIHEFYLMDEIRQLIRHGIKVSKTEQRERKKDFIFQLSEGKLSYVTGHKATAIVEQCLPELAFKDTLTIPSLLKGTVACRGVAVGEVKINLANNVEQTRAFRQRFKKGDILVTEMTQPHIIDIASKAAAIVTDEGGMLSHAAIFARELNIPCIVGTAKATKVLKEGDLVKVDAQSGIGIVSVLSPQKQ